MSASTNPYLLGYEQFIRRANDVQYNRTEPQPSSVQPKHPILINSGSARTPGLVSRTNVPAPVEPAQTTVQVQPSENVDGSSSIDILVPVPSGGVSSQPFPLGGLNTGGATTRPQTPTTLNIIARPPGGTTDQMEGPSVEITISTQPEELQPYVSHLQGLTVQQMLDLDIDALVVTIDEHHSQAKKAVLEHVMDTKARLMQSKNDAVEEEKRKGAAQLATKEEEINLLKVELDTTRIKGQRLWDLVGRCCVAYDSAKERRRTNLVQLQVFCSWRRQALLLARRRRLLVRAERWDTAVRLKRNVFCAWFREAMRAHRVTVNNRYIQEVEKAKRLIHEHYQRQIEDMERMLAEAHQQLEREAETRSRLEEDMKRAFMRGVCALNIEAMNMMKRGPAAGGPNPAGAAAPSSTEQQQPPEPATGGGVASTAPAFTSLVESTTPAVSEPANPELRGSVTFSPRIPAQAGQGGVGSGGGLGPSSSAHPPMVTNSSAARMSASGTSTAPTVSTALTGGGGGSSRPSSSYGSVATGGGNSLLLGKTGAGLQQATAAVVGHGPSTSGGAAESGLAVRETAQTFYQRPQVIVTRGPGLSFASSNSEVPRPRTNAPLPTVRMV